MRRLRARMLPLRAWIRAAAAGSTARVVVGRGVRLARRAGLLVGRGSASSLELAEGAAVGEATSLLLRGGPLRVGPGADVGADAVLETAGGGVDLGARVRVRQAAVLRAQGGAIEIGPDAVVGEFAVILAGPDAPVRIGAGAEIGLKATLLPGAEVPDGARVPAGALVEGRFRPPSAARRTGPRRAATARPRSARAARSG